MVKYIKFFDDRDFLCAYNLYKTLKCTKPGVWFHIILVQLVHSDKFYVMAASKQPEMLKNDLPLFHNFVGLVNIFLFHYLFYRSRVGSTSVLCYRRTTRTTARESCNYFKMDISH